MGPVLAPDSVRSRRARAVSGGISRRVGYEWLARHVAEGGDGLVDQRRVAHAHPHRMADDVAARLVACRTAQPTWGLRKLLAYLERRHSRTAWPPASSVGALLKRGAGARAAPPAESRASRPTSGADGRAERHVDNRPHVVRQLDTSQRRARTDPGIHRRLSCVPPTSAPS